MAIISGTEGGRVRPARPPRPPDVHAQQQARGGMSDAAEAAAQDDFVRRLEEARLRAQGGVPPDRPSAAAQRAIRVANDPGTRERFIHETDVGNVESIRRGGIRPSRGGGAMGHEGVYAYRGGAEGRPVPEGRALIEFEADPRRISGRGTMGSQAVALGGGQIDPDAIVGGWGNAGRLFDVGSSAVGGFGAVHGLIDLVDQLSGGRANEFLEGRMPRTAWWLRGGPLYDAFQDVLTQSESSPYRQTPVTLA